MTTHAPRARPGVRVPPPLIFVVGFLVAWVLDRFWRAIPLLSASSAALGPIGFVLLVGGVALSAWAMLTFRRAHTAIIPIRPARRVVSHGPYRFTRNPMYVGLTIAYIGIAVLYNSAWPLILLPLVLIVLVRTVIEREEAYLRVAFGTEYIAYQSRVRRWL
jgi:protein-S-isoprenylcysteine O-methyltransferase Ste14